MGATFGAGVAGAYLKTRAQTLLRRLGREYPCVEVYCKRSRSRTTRWEAGSRHELQASEGGTAIRAGTPDRSYFAACTLGDELDDFPWPAVGDRGLELADGADDEVEVDAHPPAMILEALLGPAETTAFLETIRDQLRREAADARLLRAVIEDGSAEHLLVNSAGIERQWRTRTGALLVEADLSGHLVRSYQPSSSAKDLRPRAVARRVASRLHLRCDAVPFEGDHCEVLLAPSLAAELLSLLWPDLLVASQGRPLGDRLASSRLTVLEDARLEAGPLRTPYDGVGRATRRTVLLDDGQVTASLATLADASLGAPSSSTIGGWSQRPSWRDAPAFAPTHLCIAPDPKGGAGPLIGSVVRGVYLLEGELRRRPDATVQLVGSGYTIRRGRAQQSVRGVVIRSTLPELLQQVRGVGRDLEYVAGRLGCFAAPTLLLARRKLEAELDTASNE